jgi:hypothetical protein
MMEREQVSETLVLRRDWLLEKVLVQWTQSFVTSGLPSQYIL